jgi:hypothetical protein
MTTCPLGRAFDATIDAMASNAPSRFLTQAGREVLEPMGIVQKGRSRIWLDDHGWWIGLIEFQPSGFSNGAYLNVGVAWCWMVADDPHVSFSLGYREKGHVEYESDEQFEPEARSLAVHAADRAEQFRSRLSTMDMAANEARQEGERVGSGWPAWDAGVALGLASGDPQASARWFQRVAASEDDRDWWLPVKDRAEAWQRLVVDDRPEFRREVKALIQSNREAMGLPSEHAELSVL